MLETKFLLSINSCGLHLSLVILKVRQSLRSSIVSKNLLKNLRRSFLFYNPVGTNVSSYIESLITDFTIKEIFNILISTSIFFKLVK